MIIHSTTLDTEAKVKAIYGGTTWVKIEGRFLLGQSNSYAINSTGGEETHTLTVNEIPSHTHTLQNSSYAWLNSATQKPISGTNRNIYPDSGGYNFTSNANASSFNNPLYNNNTGGGQSHNNMPPYKTVYIWERTA